MLKGIFNSVPKLQDIHFFFFLFFKRSEFIKKDNSASAAGLFRMAPKAYDSHLRAFSGLIGETDRCRDMGNEGGFNQIHVH